MDLWLYLAMLARAAMVTAMLREQGKRGVWRTKLVLEEQTTGERLEVPFVTITV